MRAVGDDHESVRDATRYEREAALANAMANALDVDQDLAVKDPERLVLVRVQVVGRDLAACHAVLEQKERAGISRSTAYRYFRNQDELVGAAYPELDAHSLLGPDDPVDDAARRVEIVVERLTVRLREREAQLRAQLRLSLLPGGPARNSLPLRQGRAIRWLEEALEPVGDRMPSAARRRLALAIRATTGIEAYVWLTDVGGVAPEQAVEIMRASAKTLVEAALPAGPGPGKAGHPRS